MSPSIIPVATPATDQQVLSWLQRRVQETDDAGTSWPSGLWTVAEVIGYLNERQQQFMRETGIMYGLAEVPVLGPSTDYPLPYDCATLIRVTWIAADGSTRSVYPMSSFEIDNLMSDWGQQSAQRPIGYLTQADVPNGWFRIGPVVGASGTLRLLYLPMPDEVTGAGDTFVIPIEYLMMFRFGVLQDMLKKPGRGQDLHRAQICGWWWDLGVMAAQQRLAGVW